MIKEWLRYIFFFLVCVACLPILLAFFLFFWGWEKLRPEESRRFWDEVYKK